MKRQKTTRRNDKEDNDYEDKYSDHDEKKHNNTASFEKYKLYRDNNHIYFRCDVSIGRVIKLCSLIDDYNRENDLMALANINSVTIPKPLYLHITSYGGDLLAGFMAYDHIKNSKTPIYTVAEGYTVSAGSLMYMAGRRRYMTESSYMLVHQLSEFSFGRNTFHNSMDNALNNIEFMSKCYAIYLNNIRYTGDGSDILTKEKLENHMLHDIYWNYETCKKYGLVDGLYTNYSDRDMTDVHDILNTDRSKFTFGRLYNEDELKPSDEIMNKLKENITINNNVAKAIREFLDEDRTMNNKDGIINEDEKNKKKKKKRKHKDD